MGTDSQQTWTPRQLREMDDEEARQTLPVAQYERREKLLELDAQAAETQDRWDDEAETVAEITVRADLESLGTRVDVFGNDLLVHIDSEDEQFRDAVEGLESDFADLERDAVGTLDDAAREQLADYLLDMLDAAIAKWGDSKWERLPIPKRGDILEDCREKWGVDGLMLAWVNIAEAVNEDREEKVSTIESFRNPERRGNR